jgi:hypothetical protein
MPFRESFILPTDAPLWSLHADEFGPRPTLALELRPPETGQGRWVTVDLFENQAVDVQAAEENDTWLTLRGVFGGWVLLQRYPDRQSPQPRGLLAFDARTGQPAWQLDDAVLGHADGRTFTASRLTPAGWGEPERFDLTTGQPVAVFPEKPIPSVRFPLQHPQTYADGTDYFALVARFVRRLTGHEAVGRAEYLQLAEGPAGGYLLVSYYLYASETPENWLLVVDKAQSVWLHERIGVDSRPGQAPFRVYANRLVVVKNKAHLVVYEL